MDYKTAREQLDSARSREAGKPIANNTRIFERLGENGERHAMAIRLHNTDIVRIEQSDTVELDSGGWLTVTTKERMNRYVPAGVGIFSDQGIWYVREPGEDWTNAQPYFDGIRISRLGRVTNGLEPGAFEEYKRIVAQLKKRITAYARGFEAELAKGMPMPGTGDCWYCSMFDRVEPTGDRGPYRSHTLPEKQGPGDHLEGHLEESYYVPTLAVNALREAGYQDAGIYFILRMDPENGRMGGESSRGTVARAIREYMKKRLLPDPPQPESENDRMAAMAEQPELFAD